MNSDTFLDFKLWKQYHDTTNDDIKWAGNTNSIALTVKNQWVLDQETNKLTKLAEGAAKPAISYSSCKASNVVKSVFYLLLPGLELGWVLMPKPLLGNENWLVSTHAEALNVLLLLEHFDNSPLLTVRFRFLLRSHGLGEVFRLRLRSLLRQALRRLFRADDLLATAVATHFQIILF